MCTVAVSRVKTAASSPEIDVDAESRVAAEA